MTYKEPKGPWTKDLAWANSQERRVERLWELLEPGLRDFRSEPDGSLAQRRGVDRTALWDTPLIDEPVEFRLQEKIRRRKFAGDVLFELRHVHDSGRERDGWAQPDCLPDVDLVGWFWLPKVGPDVGVAVDRFRLQEFCEWLVGAEHRVPSRYKFSTRKGNGPKGGRNSYRTDFVVVPIDALEARIGEVKLIRLPASAGAQQQ